MSAYDPIAAIYEDWSEEMTEDVPFYAELAAQADGPLVELAVGTGRVAVPVAQATRRTVIGIDSSPAMLARARAAADETNVDLDLREGDMRELALDEPAALVYCPARSLLHLPTWRDRRLLFERVAASLRPGGRFAWNAFVFDHHIAARLDGTAGGPHGLALNHRYVPTDNRVDVTAATTQGPTELRLWWVARSEWEGLLDVSGLETEALYGWFDRRPFDESSREFVWIARKPT